MGYDFHVTRAEDWTESEDKPITRDEWLAFVEHDPELRLDPKNSEEEFGPDIMALWSRDSEVESPWIAWSPSGELYSKNPDSPLRRKMYSIAMSLDAKLVGDEGEEYGPDGEEISMSSRTGRAGGALPFWKRLLGG